MRISGFSAAEFGALRNVKGTLARRLSVVWGENESGKTTLARFFRYLLFAEPCDGEAAQSCKGTLLVRASNGQDIRLEPGGGGNLTAEPELADAYLGFDAFFNFMNFTKKLDELERGLYVPNSPEASLNKLRAELEANDLQIESLQSQYQLYWELRETLEKKRESLKDARLSLEKNRAALARAELTAKARPHWLQARALEAELARLASERLASGRFASERLASGRFASERLTPARRLPERGMERLDSLNEKIKPLRARLNELKRKNAYGSPLRRQMENNPIMTLLKYGETLEELERVMERGVLTEAEFAALSAEAAGFVELLKRELMEIAPHWSEEELRSADLSLAAERHGKKLRDTVLELKERFGKLLAEKAEGEKNFAALRAEAAARRGSEENSGELADYNARREILLAARSGLLHQDALRWEIRGEKACAELIEKEMKGDAFPPRRPPCYMAKILLALLFSLAGVAVAFGVAAPEFRHYGVYSVLFCALAALGPVLSILMSRKEHLARLTRWKARNARRNDKLDGIDETIMEQRREMQSIDASMEQAARMLGLEAPVTLSGLDEAVRLLENEYHIAASLELKKAERKQLAEELEKSGLRLAGLKETLSEVTRELDSAVESWDNWLLQNRFGPGLTPESFDSFWARASAARDCLKALDAVRRKLAAQREYEASIDARINGFNAQTGLELDRDGLPAVFNSLREARSLQARVDALLEERRVIDSECSGLEKELAAAAVGLSSLCEEAGADNEDELRAMFEEDALRSSLENRLTETKRALEGILGKDALCDEPELLKDGFALAEETEAIRLAAADCEQAAGLLRGEIEALEERMNSIAPDGQAFALRQRNEILRGSAKKDFRRLLSVVLLRRFAEKAAARRGNNPEPDTLRQARQFLSLIAEPGWEIVPDEKHGGCRFALERGKGGVRLDETQWSSGLAEQVRLSMRLAAACGLAERSEPVPIMLDDALIHFDENRQRGAIDALWLASEKIQVIFFTCHRSTVDMFQSRLGDEKEFAVVEMPKKRGSPRAARRV